MSKLRERRNHVRRWVRGETGDNPNETFDDVLNDALDLLDEMANEMKTAKKVMKKQKARGFQVFNCVLSDFDTVLAKYEGKS